MKAKSIVNIVFYKFFDGDKEIKKACIFYRDGSMKDTTYAEGIDACEEIVKERNITSGNAFKEMINREIVHVMSAEDFRTNYNKFVCHEPLTKEIIEEIVDEKADKINDKLNNEVIAPVPVIRPEHKEEVQSEEEDEEEKEDENLFSYDEDEEEDEYEAEDEKESNEDYGSDPEEEVVVEQQPEKEGFLKRCWRKWRQSALGVKITCFVLGIAVGLGLCSCAKRQTLEGQMFRSNLTTASDRVLDDGNAQLTDEQLAMNNAVTESTTENAVEQFYDAGTNSMLVRGNNDYYDNYSYEQLLAVTQSQVQKTAMTNAHDALFGFNEKFAENYVEKGKDVRPALTFDEIIALQQAYNDYSKQELRAIFNGAEIDASRMENDYKSATLQLMGAHILENSKHPVDMSMLLETEEGKAFYEKYHELFLAAKEAHGKERLKLVEQFYKMVRADFPITNEVRTEGISHADRYADLESYKISVVPMIAASEMLFQNLEVDYTLNDTEVDFLNDIGLCNVAYAKYGKIETITLNCCEEDNTNPLYEQYRNAMIKYLKDHKHYVIDDAHRELTKLDRFSEVLEDTNHVVKGGGSWSWAGQTTETTETTTETVTWTETTTETHEEVTVTEAPIPDDERARIDAEIEAENEEARRRAEEEAERERQRLQEEADRHAEEVRQEVEEDEQDMQERIEDANEQIEHNQDSDPTNDKPVNESDFGDHNVDFYDEHEDGNGNLNDSVENITTDPTGDQTGQPLPDPNETGAEFDRQAEDYQIPTEIIVNSSSNTKDSAPVVPAAPVVPEAPQAAEPVVIETPAEPAPVQAPVETQTAEPAPEVQARVEEEPVFTPVEVPQTIQVDENTVIEIPAISNEDIVEEYISGLENQPEEDADYEYVR